MQFLISTNQENLNAAIAGKASATVEAEYGDYCVEGTLVTMAHHGSRSGNPAPCSYENGCGDGVEVVGLSHLDLDSLGGCMALLGNKPEVSGFWELAEFVDLNGPHKLHESGASEENLSRLHAFWAWNQENKTFADREGGVTDITDRVEAAAAACIAICNDDEELLAKGQEFQEATEALNASSFIEEADGVVVRVAAAFTNHLYNTPSGEVCAAVVAFNPAFGNITVSFADNPSVSACDIVQSLWGPEAGGHAGIAGSPRGTRMTLSDLMNAASAVRKAVAQ